ncbi:FG-GAP repeat domain-containing protein [Fimbriiglobus ruber]|nr:VCBS repeat-containing protein [Fimbriiglobus ruber]
MRIDMRAALAAAGILALTGTLARAADPAPIKDAPTKEGFPKFKIQEIATDLKIGYAVLIADINGDKKPDIVVVDQFRVVWYENPTWKVHTIIQGKTKPDNVCAAALDIDGDGQLDLVLGAAWKPFDTQNPGTLQWLRRGKSIDDEWTMYPIPCDEPTVHRVRAIDVDGDGKPEIVVVPLMGRESTAKANWADGRPTRVVAYKVPASDPEKPASWKPEVLSDSLHVAHNFCPASFSGHARKGTSILVGSYEGVSLVYPEGADKWTTTLIHPANQANPKSNRGASEIKQSAGSLGVIATIEPWHGNQVVVYTPGKSDPNKPFAYDRQVLDDHLRWGHAVWFADLDGDGTDELVIGVRDDPNPKLGDTFTERRGVRIYKAADPKGAKWERHVLEDGGVAVEDLTVADLNGDGKPDIVAVGRQTGNVRVYWNQGK